MELTLRDLPTLNATLNGIAAVLLVCGFISIKMQKPEVHKRFMLAALGVSACFLTSYLIYHFSAPPVKFQGEGFIRIVYFLVLVPHIILAIVQLPLILLAVLKAFKADWEGHKKMVKWAFPMWMYVSVTGVMVYWMLYQMDFS